MSTSPLRRVLRVIAKPGRPGEGTAVMDCKPRHAVETRVAPGMKLSILVGTTKLCPGCVKDAEPPLS